MMLQQKNIKVFVYFFLFFLLGTISNKNLNKFEIPKIKEIKIIGLSDEDNSELLNNFDFLLIENLLTLDKKRIEKIVSSNNLVEKYEILRGARRIRESQFRILFILVFYCIRAQRQIEQRASGPIPSANLRLATAGESLVWAQGL